MAFSQIREEYISLFLLKPFYFLTIYSLKENAENPEEVNLTRHFQNAVL